MQGSSPDEFGGWGQQTPAGLSGQMDSSTSVPAGDPSLLKAASGHLAGAASAAALASATGGDADAVTSAMVQHLAREFTAGSLSMWPQFVQGARRYFSVNHGYVARKLLWLAAPMPTSKRKSEGEIVEKKDWSSRVFEGLEVDMEEPDMYLPLMGFVTYVLLCGVTLGLQERFQPDVLSATVTYAVTLLVLEVSAVKAVLFMTGASAAPTFDLVAILGYKYCYVAVQLAAGLFLGFGQRPSGFLYTILTLALYGSCSAALWQTFRKLQRMHPVQGAGQEGAVEIHALAIKIIPIAQVVMCWLLIPSWPRADAASSAAGAVAAGAVTTTLKAAAKKAAQAAVTHVPLVNASAARKFP
eukprot:CAMPEP_0178373858 /NCGR_PEP_ID=MMETSP0689_2-20121128/2079_1 /TAXON_ID=160604 /ORGANISM="Amphidinium massartii, Strain CS-259" /LENGTH=355 /DNA_ID=CAMNT_0019993813 /DNA_START=45 /DNA_END=1112 /DNA_ORIENTATION=-